MADDSETPPARPASGDIPAEAEGSPPLGERSAEFDTGDPVGPTPAADFWQTLYGRRSIRKFDPAPPPRELVEQVMHAGIWAPSSCNYQMWDLVAVDDPETNRRLGELSLQMANAPVNIVVSYGRAFSEEAWANIQSASALIQNMSLAAHALGLGTFWITQMGDAEKVRETVGLPYDRLVIAVVALGRPKFAPRSGPKRRPLGQVTHWNHYAGEPIPSSTDPADWNDELLALYQRARVLNGLRHNKPRPWETAALLAMLERMVPAAPESPPGDGPRWLDVLPCTGILTERMSRERPGYRFDVAERSPEVASFCARRTRPRAGQRAWPTAAERADFPAPEEAAYDVVTCLFRLEDLAPDRRGALLADVARWLRPGGSAVVGFVSKRSFHPWTEFLRSRRAGPAGVEYVLSPDPNIGPFESLVPGEVRGLAELAGLQLADELSLQAAPAREELAFRVRHFSPTAKRAATWLSGGLRALERLPGFVRLRGRFRFLRLVRP